MTNVPVPDLSTEDLRIIVIALRKAAQYTPNELMAARERRLAYRLAQLIPPPFTSEEVEEAKT